MKTATLQPLGQCPGSATCIRRLRGLALTVAFAVATVSAVASPVVSTLTGGPAQGYPPYHGYLDGDTAAVAQFHTPYGVALDSTGSSLFVADRDNDAVRQLDLAGNQTFTFVPNLFVIPSLISKPVGVAVDGDGNVYVLNRGNGSNGTLLKFDTYGDYLDTLASGLINASGLALDPVANAYVTVQGNTLIKITPTGVKTIVATIANANTALQGLIVRHNGTFAICDSGNHGIWSVNPATGVAAQLVGFNGAGDYTGLNNRGATTATVKFNQPFGVAEAGDGTLILTDTGNHRVKIVSPSLITTNLYGVSSNYWGNGPGYPVYPWPGWSDGTVVVPDTYGDVEARQPVGVVFSPDGTVYVSEDYYHLIRKVTGAAFGLPPPPPPPVPSPTIGWVNFPYPRFLSVLNPGSSFVFNNDVIVAIEPGASGSQVFYTSGATPAVGSIPDPSPTNGSSPPHYTDNLLPSEVVDLGVIRYPDMLIKAIGTKNDGSPNSAIVQARFQFIVANPTIQGNNAASFTVTNQTFGAQMWYTTDGSDPAPTNSSSVGPISSGTTLSINAGTDVQFKIRGFRAAYQPSAVVSTFFSPTNFVPNRITFGLTNGEPSSAFVARPGQFYYAPVTLQLQPGGETMYSLQFNVTVTNGLVNPNTGVRPPGIVNGAGIDFFSMLVSQVPKDRGDHLPPNSAQWYLEIPPIVFGTGHAQSGIFVNPLNNLLGVGWLYRQGYLYTVTNAAGSYFLNFDTTKHDLIKYSIAHDTLFDKANGVVVVGAYSFQVPSTAGIGDKYYIQLGSPSGTRDGIGAPGSEVFIQAPSTNQAVTVGLPSYLVGDAAPFHWLNAGDFGNSNLDNADVMQVFQSAILYTDMVPTNSDLFGAMDSCGRLGTFDKGNGYYFDSGSMSPGQIQAMFDGGDPIINQVCFGDTNLDVADVYVTFRRSLDPSLVWFRRFWTNGLFAAMADANLAYNTNIPAPPLAGPFSYQKSSVQFVAGDAIATGGQTVQIPVTAKISGDYPLRVLALNITVTPLDGSPSLTQAIQFAPSPALGAPTIVAPKYAANYSAAWLDSGISGLNGNALIGTLTITIPSGAPSSAAYAVHFDHASASPNGLARFPKQTQTGLLTLSDRSASSWNDGIPDSWRLRYFGTVNNLLSAATADADGDGASNWAEFVAGTGPTDGSSVLRVNASGSTTPGYTVRWPSVAGKTYVVERSTALFGGSWAPISTNAGTGGDIEFTDTGAGGPNRFYRVRVAQ